MTTIEQLAKEFSKGDLAIEAAFLAVAKQARDGAIFWGERYTGRDSTSLRNLKSKIEELL